MDYEEPLVPDTMDYDKKTDEKPLYKLKMFENVGSKVAEQIKQFKTYHPYKKKSFKCQDDGLDHLINKVQGEIQQQEKQNLANNCMPVPAPQQ